MKNILLFALALFLHSSFVHAQIITTIAGNGDTALGDGGLAINAGLDGPIGVALDGNGNFYIADTYNNRIRKVNTAGIITTIAGNDTTTYNGDNIPATAAHLLIPAGIICDHFGNLYFADAFHNRVRKIDTAGIITTMAGNGIAGYNGDNIPATSAEINDPHSIVLDAFGNLYFTDLENSRIRKVDATGIITTTVGTGVAGYTGDNGQATTAEINNPYGIVIDNTGNIYFSDYEANVVRKIDVSGIITTFAGGGSGTSIGDNGPADSATLNNPAGIAIDGNGNIYIADAINQRIRKVTAISGIITTIAGDGIEAFSGDNGLAINAELNEPTSITIDAMGNIYISDFGNNRIRYIRNTTAVNNINNQQTSVSIYPNPSDGRFTINITSNVSKQTQIIITNSLGEKVKEVTAIMNTPLAVQLDQPSGIYYLSVISAHTALTQKIIINKCC